MATNGTYKIADLCEAATDGNVSQIQQILDAQPDLINVHMAENNEHRAIHFAVMNQHADAVRVLMERGANHTSGIYPHRDATTALTMAEERGYDDIVQVLRNEDEKRKLAACKNITISEENDALFNAVQKGQDAKALVILDQHPDLLDACHRNGGSVIYAAASHGRYQLVQELLKRGADIEHLTPEGQSPLDGAVHNIRGRNKPPNEGCLICAGILLQAGCKVSLESAVALGDQAFVRQYAKDYPKRFQSNDSDRDGLIQIAVQNDDIDMVRLLLDLGLHPDDRYQLHEYESKPYSWGQPLLRAAGNAQYEIAEILLECGADPNASIYASGNPISAAYNNQDDKMKGLLFRYGATLDHLTAGFNAETSAAAVALQNDPSLAEDLLWAAGCGGDPNIVGMCLRQLDWNSDDSRWFRLLEQPLRQWRTHPHRKFRNFDRAVYFDIFHMILDHGINPSLVGRFGYRLAHHLAACGVVWGEPIMTEPERVRFAEILLDHGADPTLAGAEWATPLAWAEKKGYDGIADLVKRHL